MTNILPELTNSSRLSIQEAAKLLKVSTKTLRRWEKQGLIAPERTPGNQRRYNLYQLQNIGKGPAKPVLTHNKFSPPPSPSDTPSPTPATPKLKNRLFPKLSLLAAAIIIFAIIPAIASYQSGLASKAKSVASNALSQVASFFTQKKPAPNLRSLDIDFHADNVGSVLADTTLLDDFVFSVNVPAVFSKTATISGQLTAPNIIYSLSVGEGLNITGGQNPIITLEELPGDQRFFSNLLIDTTTISATQNSDTFTLAAGANVSISADIASKKITISSTDTDTVGLTGTIGVANGGTGVTSYTTGDILYASAPNTLSKLPIGSNGNILTVSGGIPSWSSSTSGCTTNCLITNPSTSQTIIPTSSSSTGLIVAQAPSGTVDIFSVTNNSGATKYLFVDSTGQVNINGSIALNSDTISDFTGNGLQVSSGSLTIRLVSPQDGLSSTTSSASGLEIFPSGITLLQGCANSQVLKWNESTDLWECANDSGASSAIINVEQDDVLVSSTADTLDFNNFFTLTTEGGGNEININIRADSLNFSELSDSMTLDASTTIASSIAGISLDLNVSPAGTATSPIAFEITPTFGIDATDQTLIGLNINPNTNSNTDAGDVLYGINIANITGTAASETALRIGSGWDTNLFFNDTTTVIGIADAGSFSFQDSGGNVLATLTDNSNLGDLTITGDLAVNGGDITSTGALTITPGAGNNLNIALSGAGNFAVNTNQLFVNTSTGSVGIGTSSPASGMELHVAGDLQLGLNGTGGTLTLYNELGTTDYTVVFQPSSSQSQNITYTLPPDDGNANYVLTTDGSGVLTWSSVSGIGGMNSFTLSGDTGTDQTINDGNTLEVAGGIGINTVAGATDTITINFDSTEIGSTTWGSGSGFTWTFDAGATDPTLAFASNQITIGGAATLSATSVTTFNCTDCIDWDDIADSTTLDAATTIASSIAGISLDLNVSPAGTATSPIAFEITPTFGIDATDQTLIGLNINPNTNSNTDAGDVLYGINIANITGTAASETALRIGSGWDTNLFFNDTTTVIGIADAGSFSFQDSGGNVLATLTDNSNLGDLTITGDLAVNGGDITSTGALTITPGAGNNLNIALSGAGNFAVNTNQLFVNTSTGSVGIGTSSPASGMELHVAGDLQLGLNGTGGTLTLYNELGTTDYTVVFQPSSSQSQNITYTLPPDDGNANYVLTTDGSGVLTWSSVSGIGGMNSFTLSGDTGTDQTINDGNTLEVAGGIGINTVAGATDTITINFDSTEIGSTTWGSGSGFTWTFDAGATDPTLAFASNQITIGGAATLSATSVTTFNCTDCIDWDDIADSTTLDAATTIASSIAGISLDLNVSPAGTAASPTGFEITPTFGIDATDQTLIGLNINPNTNSNTDSGDILYGLNLANITGTPATEQALRIGSGWDTNLFFNDTTTVIGIADAGSFSFQDSGGNVLATLTDNSNLGDLTITGDLAVNGGDITSTGALTITPGAGNNLNIALSGAGNFAVNTNQLFVNTSTGSVGIGTSSPASGMELHVAGDLQLGLNGTGGTLTLYNELGTTDYTVVFQPSSSQSQNITYTLPPDDGNANYVLTTDGSGVLTWSSVSGIGGMNSFTLSGDTGTDQTINDGNTLEVAGGIGINTVAGATDTITINFDSTEIGSTTWGSGSGFTWTFDAGATDPTLAFASNQITIGGAATLSATSVTTFNCTDCIDWDDIADSTTLDAATTIASSIAGISLDLNVSPAGTAASPTGFEITPTFGIDATDQTLIGLNINPNTNSNTDAGDVLYGINIANITGTAASETALRIGSGWDTNLFFNDTTTVIGIADAGSFSFQDSGGNVLATLTDNSNLGDLTITGDLAVNGGDITSTGALTITPGAGNNLNIALSGAGNFAVNTNQLFVNTSTGSVGIGTSSPASGMELHVAGDLQLGLNGTGGTLTLYNELGTTDYTVVFQPSSSQSQNITYTLPPDDGNANYVLTTDGSGVLTWSSVSGIGGMNSFTLSGDTGTDQTINDGNTLEVAGGIGINTVAGATDTITINFDSTEIGSTTWGSGSGFTWTFDAGATDPTLAFASNQITIGGAATLSATSVTTFNCTDCIDWDDIADSTTLDAATTIASSIAGISLDLNVSPAGTAASPTGFEITPTFGIDATDQTLIGLNINPNTNSNTDSGDILYGLNLANITGTPATESAIRIGTGWDDILNYNGVTVINGSGQVVSTRITGTLFTAASDTSSSSIVQGDTLTLAGGLNGIDITNTGDSFTIDFDSTEVATTTWGSGSGFTWTFDAGATDPALAFASNQITVSGAATLSAASVTTFNCTDCLDFDDLADSMTLDASTTIASSLAGISLDLNVSPAGTAASPTGFEITPTFGIDATDQTLIGLNINPNTNSNTDSGDILYGLNLANITGTPATESAIRIGTGWDDILNYNGVTVINGSGQVVSTRITGTLFTVASDTSSSSIVQGDTLTLAGGLNGIDTTNTGDSFTIDFDSTEVATTTWGSGSGFTWTFDAGATDPALAFASNQITVSGAATLSAASVTTFNCTDCLDFDDLADSMTLDASTTIASSLAGISLDLNVSPAGTAASPTGFEITPTFGIDATDQTLIGLNINPNTNSNTDSGDILYGLNLANITGTPATESAIRIGTGWDDILNYNGVTVINGSGQVVSTRITGTLFTAASDTSSSSIVQGDTLTLAGGLNGIDTTNTGDSFTIDFDSTEVATTTWGSGSGFTWTFDAGATDPALAFASNQITVSGAATLSAASVTTFNCTDCLDFDDLADSMTLDAATTITNGLSGNLTIDLTSTGDFVIQDSGDTFASFADDGTITFGKASAASTINIGVGTGADTINIGTGGTAADTIVLGNTAVATTFDFNSGAATADALDLVFNSITTASGVDLSVNALTTGSGLNINSTSTALTTGRLLSLDWSPSSLTTATGDLFRLNIGPNGNVGNLLNITDNSSTLFRVSETQIESAVPHAFTAAGDVSLAYDLIFTNQTASTLDSYGPLTIRAGESFESNDLTLRTYNSGQIVMDGSLNGTTVVSNTNSTGAGTVTVSGRGVIYFLHDNSGTTNSSFTTTINITGVPTREGTIIFIRSGCQKGATTGSQTHTCAIQVNGTQISTVATATGTGASTVLENYIAVYLNNGWRVITGTGTSDSADIAEVFRAEIDVDAAEIVSLVTGQDLKVKKAVDSDASKIIGITSTKPAIVLGEDEFDIETRKISIALAGRVPVKIDAQSDPISQGDFIGASQTPGKAKKVTSGLALGRALEDWSPSSSKDKILVFVTQPTYLPGLELASSGDLIVPGSILAQNVISQQTPSSPPISLTEINADLNHLSDRVTTLSAQIVSLQSQIGNLAVPDSLWELATDSAKLVSTLPVEIPELSVIGNTTLAGDLTVSGTTLLSQTNITGRLTVGILKFDDMLGDISSLTGAVSFNSGAAVIDDLGNLTITGQVTASKYNVDTADVLGASVGKIEIPAGLTQVLINTTAVSTASSIFVTPENHPVPVSATATQSGQFAIKIPAALPHDLKVSWWVIN